MTCGRIGLLFVLALALAASGGCGSSPAPSVRSAARREARVPTGTVVPATIGAEVHRAWFTPDGRTLLAQAGGDVYALDPRALEVRAALYGATDVVPAGDSVVVADRVWHVATDRVLPLSARVPSSDSAASPSGDRVARLHGPTLVIIDVARGTEHEVYASERAMSRVDFLGDDRILLSSQAGGGVLLDARNGRVLADFESDRVAAHAHAPIVVREDGGARIVLHDASDGRVLRELASPDPDRRLHIIVPQDAAGQILGLTAGNGWGHHTRYAWDAVTGALIGTRPDDAEPSTSVPGSTVTYRVDRSSCALYRIDGDDETVVAEGLDEESSHDDCGSLAIDTSGALGAYAYGALTTFDARTGETFAWNEPPAELGGCGELSSSIEHGLALSMHDHRLGGCTPEPHREDEEEDYVGDDIEGSGVVGRSANGRYVVATRPIGDADDDAWEATLVVRDDAREGAERALPADLVVDCMYTRDQTPDGGWYSVDECSGSARVTDDGATVYFHGRERRVSIVELSTGARRDIDVPVRHGRLELLAPGVLLVHGNRGGGALVREDGTSLPSLAPIDRSSAGLLVLSTASAVRIVDPRTFESRDVAHDATGEQWRFSADGSLLVRRAPAAPLMRIDVARAALLDPVELPEGFDLEHGVLTDDAQTLVECVDGEVRTLDLADGSVRVIAPAPGCGANLAFGFGGVLAIVRRGRATLVRPDGAQLALTGITVGQRLVWVASSEGRFWAPRDALPFLRVRGPGAVIDAELSPAEGSPLYREDLLASFLGL